VSASPGRGLATLLTLRLKVLGRSVRDRAATVFVLGPLILGTALVLLARVAHDLGPEAVRPAEPWLWAAAVLAARFAARPPRDPAVVLPPGLPVPAPVLWADRYLGALARLLPVALAVAVAAWAVGGGAARWAGLAALTLLVPLVPGVPIPRTPGAWSRRVRRAALRGLAGLAAAPFPTAWRPLVAQDLLLVGRGFSPRVGVNAALAATALLASAERAVTAGAAGGRTGLLAVALAAWALAATVFVLWERQGPTLWFLADAGCPPAHLWRAKVAVAGLLGLAAGLAGACVWAGVSGAAAWRAPVLGTAVGVGVGAMLMEGDGRPLLAGVVSLLVALGLGTLGILHPALALLCLPLAAYMERLALPRVERGLDAVALRF